MAKRRTKEEVAFNENICKRLFEKYHRDNIADGISRRELYGMGWKGSAPYTVPSSFGNYMIKQDRAKRGDFYRNYSIFKMDFGNNGS
jgi:hypothetical protein